MASKKIVDTPFLFQHAKTSLVSAEEKFRAYLTEQSDKNIGDAREAIRNAERAFNMAKAGGLPKPYLKQLAGQLRHVSKMGILLEPRSLAAVVSKISDTKSAEENIAELADILEDRSLAALIVRTFSGEPGPHSMRRE